MFGQASKRNLRGDDAEERHLDADQERKYAEIIEILLAAGYFRARITGLSRFDKVIGGMAWCITASNVDLDIDVFFQEDASMGQRIKLGENIIRALNRMKSPFRLESHQIQGGGANSSDFVNIFPVIQWLVKKVIETREETGDLVRVYSESQFDKTFQLPDDAEFDNRKAAAVDFVSDVAERYKPLRQYRRHGRRVKYLNPKSEDENVQSALLEFGEFHKASSRSDSADSANKTELARQLEASIAGGKKSANKADEDAAAEQRRKEQLKSEMSQFKERVDQEVITGLLPSNISELESAYASANPQDALTPAQAQKLRGVRLHEQTLTRLQNDIKKRQEEMLSLKSVYESVQERHEKAQAAMNNKTVYNERIVDETAKLDALETPENTRQLQMLKALVALNENLRSQEAMFKAQCKAQMASYKDKIQALQREIADEHGSSEAEIDETYQADVAKLRAIRALLAKRNREISMIERKIDEVPSRTELSQYQRQFVELYEQVAAKLIETRQYYNTYNTLDDTKSYLSKEVSILNSIHDTYKQAMAAKAGREKFVDQLNNIINTIAQNLDKMEQRVAGDRDNKAKLTERHQSLLEKERLYFKATKEFQEECRRNEQLLSALQGQQ
eukprot:TRINITY_DN1847_c0_g1_i1.p1 TRINITY_DN1847_c0_g1~~TRINITY_DN1847_c0_g1_i1.p1  ORF type:complete len:620 (-),score=223.70 TRINITY_DN1847_c0_g1_i1:534-2393(-)